MEGNGAGGHAYLGWKKIIVLALVCVTNFVTWYFFLYIFFPKFCVVEVWLFGQLLCTHMRCYLNTLYLYYFLSSLKPWTSDRFFRQLFTLKLCGKIVFEIRNINFMNKKRKNYENVYCTTCSKSIKQSFEYITNIYIYIYLVIAQNLSSIR